MTKLRSGGDQLSKNGKQNKRQKVKQHYALHRRKERSHGGILGRGISGLRKAVFLKCRAVCQNLHHKKKNGREMEEGKAFDRREVPTPGRYFKNWSQSTQRGTSFSFLSAGVIKDLSAGDDKYSFGRQGEKLTSRIFGGPFLKGGGGQMGRRAVAPGQQGRKTSELGKRPPRVEAGGVTSTRFFFGWEACRPWEGGRRGLLVGLFLPSRVERGCQK